MKHGDIYMHFKQKEYFFCGIVLPLSEFTGRKSDLNKINLAYDAHTPEGQEVIRVQLIRVIFDKTLMDDVKIHHQEGVSVFMTKYLKRKQVERDAKTIST